MKIRPTTDRLREAVFNIIGQDLAGLCILDLFSGTGSLGIESLSRGAQHAVFIDNSEQAVKLTKRNLAICGFQNRGTALKLNLEKQSSFSHPELKRLFDIIFIDPPYRKNLIVPLLEILSNENIFSNGSQVIAELSKQEDLPNSFCNLRMSKSRKYGDTKIIIYDYVSI